MADKERMRMTDAGIARLRPREREYTVWDTRTPGLGVRVRPSGGTSFVLLRKIDGRSTRLSLGCVTSRSIDDARRQCHALMARSDSQPPDEADMQGAAVPGLRRGTLEASPLPSLQAHDAKRREHRPEPPARARLRRNTSRPNHPKPRPALVRRLQPNRSRRRQSRTAYPAADSRIRHRSRSHQHQSRPRRDHEPAHRAYPISLPRRTPASAPGTRPTLPESASDAHDKPTSSGCSC